ncbi:uncharacterized protein LOC135820883 [Sycon ciliatum]|uniref:uncharacterized protein LOC135820883 n=1 Tax=Sycon ciliatum TaxID=27933 RepID=UPI0020AC9718
MTKPSNAGDDGWTFPAPRNWGDYPGLEATTVCGGRSLVPTLLLCLVILSVHLPRTGSLAMAVEIVTDSTASLTVRRPVHERPTPWTGNALDLRAFSTDEEDGRNTGSPAEASKPGPPNANADGPVLAVVSHPATGTARSRDASIRPIASHAPAHRRTRAGTAPMAMAADKNLVPESLRYLLFGSLPKRTHKAEGSNLPEQHTDWFNGDPGLPTRRSYGAGHLTPQASQPPRDNDSSNSSEVALPPLLQLRCAKEYSPSLELHKPISISSLSHPMLLREPALIRETPWTDAYGAMLLFGTPEDTTLITFLSVYAFDVGENSGQTWRIHDRIDVSFLPSSCRTAQSFIGAVASSSSREVVFIYGFGTQHECAKLIAYNPSSRRHHVVRVEGSAPTMHDVLDQQSEPGRSMDAGQPGSHVLLSAMVAVPDDVSNDRATESLVMFGGSACNLDEILGKTCMNFSNNLRVLQLVGDNFEIGYWKTWNVNSSLHAQQPSPRISPVLFTDGTSSLFVYGGISLQDTTEEGLQKGKTQLAAKCDLWRLDFASRTWKELPELTEDCMARASNSCFASHRLPARPNVAYSQADGELAVVSIAFSYGTIPLSCLEREFSVSRIKPASSDTPEWRTIRQTTTRNFVSGLIDDSKQIRSLGFMYDAASLYMVQTTVPATVNLSVEFDYMTRKPSIVRRILPRQEAAFSFPGSVGCIGLPSPILFSARPYEKGDVNFGESYSVMIGGFCALPHHMYAGKQDSWLEPSWQVMPIWSYSPRPGVYAMRVISPGPPFANRILHTFLRMGDGNATKAVVYGGISMLGEPVDRDVWCFDWLEQYWQQANLTSRHTMPEHSGVGHAAAALSAESFLIYGGMAWDWLGLPEAVNNLYVFTFSNLSTCTGSWRELSSTKPLPSRMIHTSTVYGGQIIIGGGVSSYGKMPADGIVLFSLRLQPTPAVAATRVEWTPFRPLPQLRNIIGFSLTRYSSDLLLIFGGCTRECILLGGGPLHDQCLSLRSYLVPMSSMSNVNTSAGHQPSSVIPFFSMYPMLGHAVVGDTVFGGVLLPVPSLSSSDSAVITTKSCQYKLAASHCPLGHGWMNGTCRECPMGFYSADLSSNCSRCPPLLVTKSSGSTHCVPLQPCYGGFCHGHGECSVKENKASCACTWAYLSYDNCQLPLSAILISVGIATLTLIVILIVRSMRQSRKLHRQREKDLLVSRWQLKQLANGVIIDWSELSQSIIRTIGRGSSGDVFQAELSDMQVAVKVLRSCRMDDVIFLEQFIKEIELMRTVRHPNIVMFLGAGTKPAQRSPFIVMEYVTRESLYKVLRENVPRDISHRQKVAFAVDIARGMEFLHGSATPRIHCDLKSSNLLVTQKWTVKIADFGMLRLLSTIKDYDSSNPEDNLMANVTVYDRSRQNPRRRPSLSTSASADRERTPLLSILQQQYSNSRASGTVSPASTAAAAALADVSAVGGGGLHRDSETNMTRAMGSSRWCAPETLTARVFNQCTDVYSYGVVLWEILTHIKPYDEIGDEDAVMSGIKHGQRLPLPPGPDFYHFKRIIEACWSEEPESRPLFPEILDRLKTA